MNTDIIIDNLVELLTNSVNMTSVFYDIFLNPNPMDVTLQQYNDENELITVTIPNRAKDRKVALDGEGTPEGHVEAEVGVAYVDTAAGVVYFKMSGSDQFGWVPILTREAIIPIIRNYLVNRGYVTSGDVVSYLTNEGYVKKSDTATTSTVGVVSVDGTSIVSNGGNISAQGVVEQNSGSSSSIKKIWSGTQEEFNLTTLDPSTIYFIKDSGKIYLGEVEVVCMPLTSLNDYSSITLSVSGSEAQAAANGAFYMEASSTASGDYLKMTRKYTDGSGANYKEQVYVTYATTSSQQLSLLVPVGKGDKVEVEYSVTPSDFGFYLSRAI